MKSIYNFINESKYKGNINNYSVATQQIAIVLKEEILNKKSINISLSIDKVDLGNFKDNAINHSIGHIVESYICSVLSSYSDPSNNLNYFTVTQSNNDYYDIDLKFNSTTIKEELKVEVKAYTKSTQNINFTKNQQDHANDPNLLYIYTKYSYNKGGKVDIEDILIGTFNDLKNINNLISKHGGKTHNMVSLNNK